MRQVLKKHKLNLITLAFLLPSYSILADNISVEKPSKQDEVTIERLVDKKIKKSKDTDVVEKIEVTGSRIKRFGLETAQPVSVITQQDIELTGYSNVTEALMRMPAVNGSATTIGETAGRGNIGRQSLSLRAMGAGRSLSLINGMRMAPGDTSGNTDISMIPTGMIESVEVFKGAASSVYGADAMAGVFNYKLLKDYDGVKVNASMGSSGDGLGEYKNINIVAGTTFERGGITLGFGVKQVDAYYKGDIEYYKKNNAPDWRNRGGDNYLSWYNPNGVVSLWGVDGQVYSHNAGTDGTSMADYTLYQGEEAWDDYLAEKGYNFLPEQLMNNDQKRYNLVINSYYQLTDDIEATLSIMGSHFEMFSKEAGYADNFWVDPENIYNPFDNWALVRKRLSSVGERSVSMTNKPLHIVLGVDGTLSDTWDWDASAVYSKYVADRDYPDAINGDKLDEALGSQTSCAAIEGCQQFNIFADDADLDREYLASITESGINSQSSNKLTQYQVNATGPVIELPAGDILVAVGAEYRTVLSTRTHSPIIAKYNLLNHTKRDDVLPPTRKVAEVYAEVDIPLLKDQPFAKLLTVNIAARYSDYNDAGTAFTPSAYAFWRPVDELLVRASYAEGFKAPSQWNLHRGVLQYEKYTQELEDLDVCAEDGWNSTNSDGSDVYPLCTGFGAQVPRAQPGEYSSTDINNPDLKPETATNIGLGVVWTPEYIEGLSITLDYYKVEINDESRERNSTVFRKNAITNGEQYKDLITRDPDTHAITHFYSKPLNMSTLRSNGYEFDVSYNLPNTNFGLFSVQAGLAHLISDSSKLSSLDDWEYWEGTYSNIENKYRASISWNYEAWSSSFLISGGDSTYNLSKTDLNDEGERFEGYTIPSYNHKAFNIGYKSEEFGNFNLNVKNPFDEEPPFYNTTNGYVRGHSVLGRYYTLSWNKSF